MKFQVDRESVDGLVLIDRGSMKELDDELLYAFDILPDAVEDKNLSMIFQTRTGILYGCGRQKRSENSATAVK